MKMSCVFGFHKWSGCKCLACSKARDKGHIWDKDCNQCSKCEKVRSDAHAWGGCTCAKCGRTRDEGHDWSLNCNQCCKCWKTRLDSHAWVGCECGNCGRKREHDFNADSSQCSLCGTKFVSMGCGRCRGSGREWRSALHGGGYSSCKDCGGKGTLRREIPARADKSPTRPSTP